jgi:hypothetical protein
MTVTANENRDPPCWQCLQGHKPGPPARFFAYPITRETLSGVRLSGPEIIHPIVAA